LPHITAPVGDLKRFLQTLHLKFSNPRITVQDCSFHDENAHNRNNSGLLELFFRHHFVIRRKPPHVAVSAEAKWNVRAENGIKFSRRKRLGEALIVLDRFDNNAFRQVDGSLFQSTCCTDTSEKVYRLPNKRVLLVLQEATLEHPAVM
jgi:hypothetical protein